ncbi:hypothetical protein JCM11641_002369 [Rhodosporidiobolus odoratus]
MAIFDKPEAVDAQIAQPPSDAISSLARSPAADLLAVASGNNEVRIYEVQQGGASEGRAAYQHEAPVLCVKWSKVPTFLPRRKQVISGGADNAARLDDATSGQSIQIAAHDAPVRCVEWVDQRGESHVPPLPIAEVQLFERCYVMSCVFPLLVVGTADRHILIFDLNNPSTPFKTLTSPLHMQTRALSCFPDATGFALSSIEGRVAIHCVDDRKGSDNFSFKCHREEMKPVPGPPFKAGSSKVYSVKTLEFHPAGTFVTGASDGTMTIWDSYSRTRLRVFSDRGGHAVSHDWSQGFAGNSPTLPNKVILHSFQADEVQRRPKK